MKEKRQQEIDRVERTLSSRAQRRSLISQVGVVSKSAKSASPRLRRRRHGEGLSRFNLL